VATSEEAIIDICSMLMGTAGGAAAAAARPLSFTLSPLTLLLLSYSPDGIVGSMCGASASLGRSNESKGKPAGETSSSHLRSSGGGVLRQMAFSPYFRPLPLALGLP